MLPCPLFASENLVSRNGSGRPASARSMIYALSTCCSSACSESASRGAAAYCIHTVARGYHCKMCRIDFFVMSNHMR